MPNSPGDTPCPCGTGASFGTCCRPCLTGSAQAPTAEALMRSRYCAFREGAVDYLVATRHPDARSPDENDHVKRSAAGAEWINLLILDTQRGSAGDTEGVVEFVAAYRGKRLPTALADPAPAGARQLHERSRFVREDGRWFYVDGDQLPPHRPKRNAPCWCGSGRKTRACHG